MRFARIHGAARVRRAVASGAVMFTTLCALSRSDDLAGFRDSRPASSPAPVELVDDEAPVAAETPATAAAPQNPEAPIESLTRRIESLERELAESRAGTKQAKSDGGWEVVPDAPWSIRPGGAINVDYVNWAKNDEAIRGASDFVEFRRVRFSLDGTGFGVFAFRAQYEFEPEADFESGVEGPVVRVLDNFLDMNDAPVFGRVRIGNFFVPFSMEQNTNAPNLTFLERAAPLLAGFSPSRRLGIASYNVSPNNRATLSYGVFFADVNEFTKERIADEQGVLAAVRGTWTPVYDEPSDGRYLVHLGIGYYYKDDADDLVRFRTRPDVHEGPIVIDTGLLNADHFHVANLEWATVWGPFSAQSEFFATSVDTDEGNRFLYGYYAFVSYFLTGENRNYEYDTAYYANFGPVVPFTNFWWVKGSRGLGAWELKARYDYLDFTSVARGHYQSTTVGVNWYWNRYVRWMFDWIHPWNSAATVFGETQADILAVRFQIAY